MKLSFEEIEQKGYLIAEDGNKKAGIMTITIPKNETRFIIDHTDVKPEYKGQGVGLKMLEYIVQEAREQHFTIRALCPFADKMFEKHAELRDVLEA